MTISRQFIDSVNQKANYDNFSEEVEINRGAKIQLNKTLLDLRD